MIELTQIDEYIKVPLSIKKKGEVFIGHFSVNKFTGLNVRVLVEWYSKGCCMCATYGEKTIKHNQKLQNVQVEKKPEILN